MGLPRLELSKPLPLSESQSINIMGAAACLALPRLWAQKKGRGPSC